MSRLTQSGSTESNKPISVSCDEFASLLQKLRTDSPLVQCITNYVAMDIMANTLLAVGASPAMAHGESYAVRLDFASNDYYKILMCIVEISITGTVMN